MLHFWIQIQVFLLHLLFTFKLGEVRVKRDEILVFQKKSIIYIYAPGMFSIQVMQTIDGLC